MRDILHVDINRTGSSAIRRALGRPPQARCHRTALMLRQEYDYFDEVPVVSVIRNPFSRVVSQFKHRNVLHADSTNFGQWVRKVYLPPFKRRRSERHGPKLFWPQTRWLCDEEGRQIVDVCFRFEGGDALDNGVESLRAFIEGYLRVDLDLPVVNRADDRTPWPEFYSSDETTQIIRSYFAEDFDFLGYSPEVPSEARTVEHQKSS